MQKNSKLSQLFLSFLFVLGVSLLVACASSAGEAGNEQGVEPQTEQEGEEHNEDAEHSEEGGHDEDTPERVPNDGAIIRIVSPTNGAVFKVGDEILVQIETENFPLGEEERHWELYVDGSSWGSIEGGNTDEAIRGLDPGEHEVAVFMSLGSHEQLEDGDSVTIVVEE